MDDDFVYNSMGYIYLMQYAFMFLKIYKKFDKNILIFFSPSFLTLSYICLTFGFGALYLSGYHGRIYSFVEIYYKIANFRGVNIFFLICNFIVFQIYIYNLKVNKYIFNVKPQKEILNLPIVIVSLILIILFSFIDFDLSFLGGTGSASIVPKFISSIALCLFLSSRKISFRFLVYVVILATFLITNFQSKREIIFLMVSIIFIELLYNPIKISFSMKNVIFGIFGIFIFFNIIVVSSIMRGYGSYEVENASDAIYKVPEYIQSEFFVDLIGENFEINYSYGNALNATDIIIETNQDILYGETFLKALFLVIPRSVVEKPRSMIQIYSPMINQGSDEVQPVIIYTELLWNFGYFFFIPLIIIFALFEKMYYSMIKRLQRREMSIILFLFIYCYSIFMQFVRGSGLDLLFLYLLLSLPFILLLNLVKKITNEKSTINK